MTYTYVAYSSEYRREILDLQRLLWSSKIAVNDAYFAWKYERNPYLENPIVALALYEGRVVGMRGAWGALWKIGGETEPAVVACAGDTVIATAHRGSGVLRGLNRSLLEMLDRAGFPRVFGLSASRPVFHGSIKDGWLPVIDYVELLRTAPLCKQRWMRKARDRVQAAVPERLMRRATSIRLRLWRSRDQLGISVHETPRIDAMARLIRQVEPRGAIGHVRDETYIRWRYECPLSRYLFLSSGAESLDGFLVLQHRTEHRRGTHIVDWEVASPAVFDRLVTAAIKIAAQDDLKIWCASVPAPLTRILERHGFEKSGPGPEDRYRRSVLVKETGASSDSPGSANSPLGTAPDDSWNLRMIYSDDF